MNIENAHEWIATEPAAIAKDIARLGLDGAARYNRELVKEAISRGDDRWSGVTIQALKRAMIELCEATP